METSIGRQRTKNKKRVFSMIKRKPCYGTRAYYSKMSINLILSKYDYIKYTIKVTNGLINNGYCGRITKFIFYPFAI